MQTRKHGQDLVELALTLPIFLLLVMGIIDLGRLLHCWSCLNLQCVEAARAGSKRLNQLVARDKFTETTHADVDSVRVAFNKNRSPMMPAEKYSNLVLDGVEVNRTATSVTVSANFDMEFWTPFISQIFGGGAGAPSGAFRLSSSASEPKE